jgi:hypothetical protein
MGCTALSGLALRPQGLANLYKNCKKADDLHALATACGMHSGVCAQSITR